MVAHTCDPSYLGGQGGRITGAQEVKAAMSHNHATAPMPGWQSKILSQNNNNNNNIIRAEILELKNKIDMLKNTSESPTKELIKQKKELMSLKISYLKINRGDKKE